MGRKFNMFINVMRWQSSYKDKVLSGRKEAFSPSYRIVKSSIHIGYRAALPIRYPDLPRNDMEPASSWTYRAGR